jgi:hypothetical protein
MRGASNITNVLYGQRSEPTPISAQEQVERMIFRLTNNWTPDGSALDRLKEIERQRPELFKKSAHKEALQAAVIEHKDTVGALFLWQKLDQPDQLGRLIASEETKRLTKKAETALETMLGQGLYPGHLYPGIGTSLTHIRQHRGRAICGLAVHDSGDPDYVFLSDIRCGGCKDCLKKHPAQEMHPITAKTILGLVPASMDEEIRLRLEKEQSLEQLQEAVNDDVAQWLLAFLLTECFTRSYKPEADGQPPLFNDAQDLVCYIPGHQEWDKIDRATTKDLRNILRPSLDRQKMPW